jgi:hypothetical protein
MWVVTTTGTVRVKCSTASTPPSIARISVTSPRAAARATGSNCSTACLEKKGIKSLRWAAWSGGSVLTGGSFSSRPTSGIGPVTSPARDEKVSGLSATSVISS